MKVELSFVVQVDGVWFAVMAGTTMMLRWFVVSWDTMWEVS